MDTFERMKTLQQINAELDNEWAEKQTDDLKLKSSQVHLSGQTEVNLSERSTRGVSLQNDQKAMQLSNRYSNNCNDVTAEETQRMKMYKKCLTMFHILGFLLGIRISHHWKPQKYFLFYSTCFFLFFTGLSISYTVHMHVDNGEYVRILEPLAIFGIFISCAFKMHGFLRYRHHIFALMFSLGKYCKSNIFGRRAGIVESNQRKSLTLLLTLLMGCMVSGSAFAFTPITVYITTKEVIPLMPVEVVFCDQSQKLGFIGATFVHMCFGFYAATATMIYGAASIFCICNYIFQVDLISEDFRELDGMWNCKNNIRVAYKRAFLKNICRKRQDMNNYLNVVKEVFEAKLFKYFCTSYLSQIICLYDVTQHYWIGGYGPAFALFLEMMFYCYMGTQVSIVDDKLSYTIYNCNWYMYDLESQQMVSLLLHECQQSKELQLGPIGPLNLVTGIAMIKGIYSYYTVLTELI